MVKINVLNNDSLSREQHKLAAVPTSDAHLALDLVVVLVASFQSQVGIETK